MPQTSSNFKYVDLFAGIGGFAAALNAFGGESVYSVEIDPAAAKVYELNWGHNPLGDITRDANELIMNVPEHDILVAGFPCQPFSKSGSQLGMEETRGTLYWNILRIITTHFPSLVVLENVRNLAGPRHKHEWEVIIATLRQAGYLVSDIPAVLSPHLLTKDMGGRPQIRERVFITATFVGTDSSTKLQREPVTRLLQTMSRSEAVDSWDLVRDLPVELEADDSRLLLSPQETRWINAWDDWVKLFRDLSDSANPPGFPIWTDSWVPESELEIPNGTPDWKAKLLLKNSRLYTQHKPEFDDWLRKHKVRTADFPPSRRKLEWQAQDSKSLWDCAIHFRPSGVRVKRLNYLPALVAINQTSIIGPLSRRLSTRETARLQGLPEWFSFGDQVESKSYKQLGNGVNVGVVWNILKAHVARDFDILNRTERGRIICQSVSSAPTNPDDRLDKRAI